MTETIDRVRAVELLERVVDAKGENHVYRDDGGASCQYFDADGKPLCIVGHALAEVGVGLSDLSTGSTQDPNTSRVRIVNANGVVLTDGARYVFDEAQGDQDDGATWGHALQEARALAYRLDLDGVL